MDSDFASSLRISLRARVTELSAFDSRIPPLQAAEVTVPVAVQVAGRLLRRFVYCPSCLLITRTRNSVLWSRPSVTTTVLTSLLCRLKHLLFLSKLNATSFFLLMLSFFLLMLISEAFARTPLRSSTY